MNEKAYICVLNEECGADLLDTTIMSSVIEPLIISQSGAIFIYRIALVCLLLCIFYWRNKAAEAYCELAMQAKGRSDRKNYSRKGLFIGSSEAAKVFAANSPELFMKQHPFAPFRWRKITCVFTHYYFSHKRHKKYLSPLQLEINERILALKDGNDKTAVKYLINGLNALLPSPGTIVLFMPCSTAINYKRRFTPFSFYLKEECPKLVNGYWAIRITEDRQSLHTQKGRSNIDLEKNYVINMDLRGKKVIIFDDIMTSGKSLREFAAEIKAMGGIVEGAIFAARTFKMPTYHRIWFVALIDYYMECKTNNARKQYLRHRN